MLTAAQTEALKKLDQKSPGLITARVAGSLRKLGYVTKADCADRIPLGYSFAALTDAGRKALANA